ncbi:Transposase, Rhodopirellula-type, partial [Candidatus Magnetomorum sp. HK-1]
MINFIFSWRRNLIFCLYFLLFINCFFSQTKQMSAEFWIQNQHFLGISSKTVIVQRKKRFFRCLCFLPLFLSFWKSRFDRQFNIFAFSLVLFLLQFLGLLWIKIFKTTAIKMISLGFNLNDGFELNYSFSDIINDNSLNVNLCAAIKNINSPDFFDMNNFNIYNILNINYNSIINEEYIDLNKPDANYSEISNNYKILSPVVNQNDSTSNSFIRTKTIKEIHPYQTEMKRFYDSLNEKDRRRYAGIESLKLGHGGRTYIAEILGCCTKTVLRGIREINDLPNDIGNRIRKPGGGRESLSKKHRGKLEKVFLNVMECHTAGDPENEDLLWTNLSRLKISGLMEERFKISASETVIKKLLKAHNFHTRKAYKGQTRKSVEYRNDQFETIVLYRIEYELSGDPVISMDSKKREHLSLYRAGHLYTQKTVVTPDHDFPSYSDGSFVPHGIYDIIRNKGYISIGISKDTSEFACDSLRAWW